MIRLFSFLFQSATTLRVGGCLLSLILCPLIRATEPIDLGHGLGYLRVGSLDEAIKPVAGHTALVLDLRHVTAPPGSPAAFSAALAARPIGTRLLVLVSPDTPAAVAGALKGNLLTLGIKGSRPSPDVVVAQSAEDDRRAYDALDAGSPLAELISGRIEKDRFDEASLVQEFKNGAPGIPPDAPKAKSPEGETGPPTDRVLQRAVHLHRALLALKR